MLGKAAPPAGSKMTVIPSDSVNWGARNLFGIQSFLFACGFSCRRARWTDRRWRRVSHDPAARSAHFRIPIQRQQSEPISFMRR